MQVMTQRKTIQVSQVSGRLEPALADLAQEFKKLQVDMIDEFNGERTRFEKKVKGLETNVNDLQEEVKELKKETKELQQVIRDTRAELLPVEVASEACRRGDAPRGGLQLTMVLLDRSSRHILWRTRQNVRSPEV